MIDRVFACLLARRFSHTSELELQDAIAEAFEHDGIAFEREVVISQKDRLDFLVGDVAVEVKTQGSRADLLRQIYRYAAHERVQAIVIATTRRQHRIEARALGGKVVRVAYLGGL